MTTDAIALSRKLFTFGSLDEASTTDIFQVLTAADDLYYNDEESFLDDDQYDALRCYAERADPSNQYFVGVGSAVRGGKVALPFQMGSLNQIYQGDYKNWVTKHAIQKESIVVSHKLDGVSANINYDNLGNFQIAFSRGDGREGADISRHVRKLHNVPKSIDPEIGGLNIRGEIIISTTGFKTLSSLGLTRAGKPYKNPRNLVAGLMNSSENKEFVYQHVDFVAYEIIRSPLSKIEQLDLLAKAGFAVVKYSANIANTLNDVALTNLLKVAKNNTDYEIDGVVVEVEDAATRKRISPTRDTLNPEYAVKFKVADAANYAEPKVLGVTWGISKDGYLKPTIQIEPTELVGVTISNCSGFNAKFISDNKVGPGAIIALVRSGDVIPFCQSIISPAPGGAQMPLEKSSWTESGADLVIDDVATNKTAQFEQLNDFFDSIDAPHLREGNLKLMFDMGFETPESIIELTQEDISSLVGSKPIGKKIFEGLHQKLTNVPLYVLMGSHSSMGRGVGKRKMKRLHEAFKGDMSRCDNFDAIVNVEGFDKKTATKITDGFADFCKFFEKISKYVVITEYEAKVGGSMAGQVVVFTGFRSKELEKAVEDAGGKMGSSVSSKTTLLVIDDVNSSSSKAEKARELGVRMINVNELSEML